MKLLDTLKLTELCREYLSEKFDTSVPLTDLHVADFEEAINYYNYYRQHQDEKAYFAYLKNAAELNSIFGQDLPGYQETSDKLLNDEELTERVFSHLRDSEYFQEVWKIRPMENLWMNLLLLIYRTTILQSNRDLLIDENGQNKVQISSTIEEMVACLQHEGKKNQLFPTFKHWLKDWKTEDFDERLFNLLKQTKYILHGGNANEPCEENDKFFMEILKETRDEVKILLVPFATTPDKYEREYGRNTSQFERVKGDRIIKYTQATRENFLEQIKDAEVIYLSGGKTTILLEALSNYKYLDKLWAGKIVAGESAGMNALVTLCYGKSTDSILRCLGILPIKTIPHYREEFKEKLLGTPENLETLLLREHEYRVMEV